MTLRIDRLDPVQERVLAACVAARISGATPRQVFAGVDCAHWLWSLTEGARLHEPIAAILPGLPSAQVQAQFTGLSGDEALTSAFYVYHLLTTLSATHLARPLETVLDFGCGWGRIIRFFLRDIAPADLWGFDCFPDMIDLCRQTNRWCQFALGDPFPPTTFAADTFDLVYAYSVFSHLSEAAHLAWIAEFRRILKPGGLLIASTRDRAFIAQCAAMRASQDPRDFVQGSAASFTDTDAALAAYDRGDLVHAATGSVGVLSASFYGETCIPRAYVERVWPTHHFTVLEYIDDRTRCDQNVIVART